MLRSKSFMAELSSESDIELSLATLLSFDSVKENFKLEFSITLIYNIDYTIILTMYIHFKDYLVIEYFCL